MDFSFVDIPSDLREEVSLPSSMIALVSVLAFRFKARSLRFMEELGVPVVDSNPPAVVSVTGPLNGEVFVVDEVFATVSPLVIC